MDIEKDNLPTRLDFQLGAGGHHAYLVLGESAEIRPILVEHLGSIGISTIGNPDYFVYEEESFGVDEARLLRQRAQGRAFTGKKIFIIAPARFTHEAQNALLKTFEEPVSDTHFFIFSRDESSIIPTLRSRTQIIRPAVRKEIKALTNFSEKNLQGQGEDAEGFLELPIKGRIAFSKKFADKEKNLPAFLDSLLVILKSTGAPEGALRAVYDTRRFADDRSGGTRLILEHLALVL